jgi:hypothetical protein
MLQFYFLSILLNSLTGLTLIFNSYTEKSQDSLKNVPDFFTNNTFKLVIGILCCFTALIKLLTSFPGSILIMGDLLPAVVGVLGGIAVLFDYYMNNSPSETKLNPKLETIFVTNKKYIGVLCVLSALLHFLFPRVIIL